jgi:O-antigen ligase
MNANLLLNFQQILNYKKTPLKFLELFFLSLMSLSLPSLEAPKNIFLCLFLLLAIWNQYSIKVQFTFNKWDFIYISLILSAFLSALFAGLPSYEEWRGFRGIFTWTLFGLVLTRSSYNEKEISWLYLLVILSTLPAIIWGVFEYLIIHTKEDLQLHSVGHVNHSAIYLVMIIGSSISLFFYEKKYSFIYFLKLLLVIFFMLGIVLGRSRGGFGIGIILAFILTIFLDSSTKNKSIFLLTFLTSLLLSLILSSAVIQKNSISIVEKIYDNHINHDNLAARDRVWNISLEAFKLYPIFGVGNANFKYFDAHKVKSSIESRGEVFNAKKYHFVGHSHNIFLSALAERGIIGFIVLINFMLAWLILLIKDYKRIKINHLSQILWGGSLSAFIVTFGVGFINSTLHHEHALLAFIFLGLHLNYLKKNHLGS